MEAVLANRRAYVCDMHLNSDYLRYLAYLSKPQAYDAEPSLIATFVALPIGIGDADALGIACVIIGVALHQEPSRST